MEEGVWLLCLGNLRHFGCSSCLDHLENIVLCKDNVAKPIYAPFFRCYKTFLGPKYQKFKYDNYLSRCPKGVQLQGPIRTWIQWTGGAGRLEAKGLIRGAKMKVRGLVRGRAKKHLI